MPTTVQIEYQGEQRRDQAHLASVSFDPNSMATEGEMAGSGR
jgi:hypothetical protein